MTKYTLNISTFSTKLSNDNLVVSAILLERKKGRENYKLTQKKGKKLDLSENSDFSTFTTYKKALSQVVFNYLR